ncbi:M15 family metallopeptidase [Butyrivibrio proteoclasticus]|uniref:M15 family metallopeptidase n=1 Tax=Butyrivibrio proteoclasticus TaxID=43305 RepID=UPI00047D1875|nr:M15 family metallopeptidase [Butyrivibrio proteoclasticus]
MSVEQKYVISNDSSDFVNIADVASDVIYEIRYYSSYNFIGDRIDGYEAPVALLTLEAARALKRASDAFLREGFRIKIYDAFRPQRAVDHFVRWAGDLSDHRMKDIFYPNVDKDKLFALGFIAEHSGHSRGSTVDITLFDMAKGCDADMGGYFDLFGEASKSDYDKVTRTQRHNRLLLKDIMTKNGFTSYSEEWWHFTLQDEPFPDTYFDFPVR